MCCSVYNLKMQLEAILWADPDLRFLELGRLNLLILLIHGSVWRLPLASACRWAGSCGRSLRSITGGAWGNWRVGCIGKSGTCWVGKTSWRWRPASTMGAERWRGLYWRHRSHCTWRRRWMELCLWRRSPLQVVVEVWITCKLLLLLMMMMTWSLMGRRHQELWRSWAREVRIAARHHGGIEKLLDCVKVERFRVVSCWKVSNFGCDLILHKTPRRVCEVISSSGIGW